MPETSKLDQMLDGYPELEGAAARQRINWPVGKWRDACAQQSALTQVAEVIELLADRCGTDDNGLDVITRDDVRSVAGRSAVDLFVAAMVWGYGITGYGRYRTRRVLEQPDAAERLTAICHASRDNPEAAWDAINTTSHVKYLGPAFGTKLAYFAGYDPATNSGPLVADALIAAALRDLAPSTHAGHANRSKAGYLDYLDLAAEQATNRGCGLDDIEIALFDRGRELQQNRRRRR